MSTISTASAIGPNAMLEEAEIRLQEVQHRIGADDPTVTSDDLERAESAVRFARTRIKAARQREREQEAQAERDRVEAIRASLPTVFDTTDLEKARVTLEAALDAYCREGRTLDKRVSEVWMEVTRLGPGSGMTAQSGSGDILVGGQTYRKPSVQTVIGRMAREALRRHFPHMPIQLDRT